MKKNQLAFRVILCIAFVLSQAVFCQGQDASAESDAKLKAKIESVVDQYVESGTLNSVAIGLIEGDRELVLGFGQLGKKDKRTPDGDTLFEIGSISKVFTGVLLADAIERRLVKADQPVQELLPNGTTMPVWSKEPERTITLKDLSTHVSGFPKQPSNIEYKDPSNPYAAYQTKQLFEFLNGHKLKRKPGTQFAYSNVGVGLLGDLLAKKQECNYEQLLISRIAKPLGMTDTFMTGSASQKKRLAPPHNDDLDLVKNWDIPVMGGAGGIRSSMNDMLKFAKATLSPPDNNIGKAIELAWTEQRPALADGELSMGFGWFINPSSETRWHNGATGGYHSKMFVNRETNRALVILCNTSTNEVETMASEIMGSLNGIEDGSGKEAAKVSEKICKSYVGRYQLNPSVFIDVAFAGKSKTALTVQMTGQTPLPIYPESDKSWFLRVVKAEIEFEVNSKGKCTALTLIQGGERQKGKKVK